MSATRFLKSCWLCSAVAACIASLAPAAEPQRTEFTRLVAHWAEYGRPDYLSFVEDAQVEVAQVGFYAYPIGAINFTKARLGTKY